MNEFLRRILFLPEQGSSMAAEVDGLHYFVILVTVAGATGVAVLALAFLLKYSRPAKGPTPRIHVPLWLEMTSIGALLGLFLLWWHLGFRQYLRLTTAPKDALSVYVTAKQWMWKFSLPNGPTTIGVLYVPVGKPVRLIMTSRDMIHSLFVPEFRIKQDVLPGAYTSIWFEARHEGRYPILCTEFCGTGHSDMLAEVVVLGPVAFAAWVGGKKDTEFGETRPPSMSARGLQVAAEKGCLQCHSLDGTRLLGPTWLGLYGSTAVTREGRRVPVDEVYLTRSMMDPNADLVAGYAPLMPTYQGRLRPADTAALLELIRSLENGQEDGRSR